MVINGKRYKVVNRFRFIAFITIILVAVSFVLTGFLGLTKINGKEKTEYIEVEVCSGDTLWNLAETYGNQNTDIRQLVYEICQINNIKATDLHAGQIILIPEN